MHNKQSASESAIRREVNLRHEHAARCKKAPDDCVRCVENMAWFGALPAHVLSDVLTERPKP